jgi:hypothetical protein
MCSCQWVGSVSRPTLRDLCTLSTPTFTSTHVQICTHYPNRPIFMYILYFVQHCLRGPRLIHTQSHIIKFRGSLFDVIGVGLYLLKGAFALAKLIPMLLININFQGLTNWFHERELSLVLDLKGV